MAQQVQNQQQNQNPNYMPLTCPRCGSRELAFVTEYHKAFGLRILCIIFFSVTIIAAVLALGETLFQTSGGQTWIVTIVLAIITLFIYMFYSVQETHTHVQAICRNCGNL